MIKRHPCSRCGAPTRSSYGICMSNPECVKALRQAHARACYRNNPDKSRAKTQAWHQRNPEKAQGKDRKFKDKRRAWLRGQKVGKCCIDCGFACTEENYVAFDWDHRPGSGKLFSISQSFSKSRTFELILAEIAKCDLRCRNCHAIITHQRRLAA